jgi:hypothetical protein
MAIPQSFRRDANGVPITGLGLIEKKTITFAAGTTGAIGTTTLFTVLGNVACNVFGFCTTDLTGTGTLEIGVAGSTAALANQQAATAIDNHEVWHDAVLAVGGQVAGHEHIVNQDVILTIAGNTVTGGTIEFYCMWYPLDESSEVTVA